MGCMPSSTAHASTAPRVIPARNGGYIGVFGLANSGKSTFLHTVCRALAQPNSPPNLPVPPPNSDVLFFGGPYNGMDVVALDTPCITNPSAYDCIQHCHTIVWLLRYDDVCALPHHLENDVVASLLQLKNIMSERRRVHLIINMSIDAPSPPSSSSMAASQDRVRAIWCSLFSPLPAPHINALAFSPLFSAQTMTSVVHNIMAPTANTSRHAAYDTHLHTHTHAHTSKQQQHSLAIQQTLSFSRSEKQLQHNTLNSSLDINNNNNNSINNMMLPPPSSSRSLTRHSPATSKQLDRDDKKESHAHVVHAQAQTTILFMERTRGSI